MFGGSERIVVEVAKAMAQIGHEVTVRLPYAMNERSWEGVRWIADDFPSQSYDLLYCADDFARKDRASRTALIACRSDPPRETNFDELIFLSKHHASLMGHPNRPAIGGGVSLAEYAEDKPRIPRRVICTSSPDRCRAAHLIGRSFDFVHSYRPIKGLPPTLELTRDELRELQQTADAHIYPLDPSRPSDFFSMSVLESMAAGTPVIVSDADSMPELWSGAAIVLPRPIDLAEWAGTVEDLIQQPSYWNRYSRLGRKRAADFDWSRVASRYLAALT